MSYTTDLLDQYKTKHAIDSDYAAAKALDLRPNRLSNYRTGVSHADDKTAVILADALGLDRLRTIARINADRARDSKERAFWRQIAAAAAIAFVALFVPTGYAHASTVTAVAEQAQAICIMRNVRRWAQAFARAVLGFSPPAVAA